MAFTERTPLERKIFIQLTKVLSARFDIEELRMLCQNLGVDYDDLPAQGKANKAREVVEYFGRRNRLPELVKTVKQLRPDISWGDAPLETVDVSFVIVAMTQNEAVDLQEGTVFDDPTVAPAERTRFERFKTSLQEHGIVNWLDHYGEHRETWKPHIHHEGTIQEIILEVADRINQQRYEMSGSPLVQPQFYSADFFTESQDTKLETWERLGRLGCVIVVDAVSIFYPKLRKSLLRSEMSSNEQVAMLVLSPVNSREIPVNRLIEQEISSQMQLAFARFSKHLDRLCEFGVGDLCALQRWLFATLPETAAIIQNQRPNPSNHKLLRKQIGEPTGVTQLIFGQRGGR